MERQPEIYTEVVGNIFMPDWSETLRGADIERVELDQWTAQKSRFVARGDRGGDYAVALKRNTRVLNGDILAYDADRNRAVVVYVRLNDVLVIDLRGSMPGRTRSSCSAPSNSVTPSATSTGRPWCGTRRSTCR